LSMCKWFKSKDFRCGRFGNSGTIIFLNLNFIIEL